VDNVPRCFDEVKNLVAANSQGIRKKVKTLNDQLITLDKNQSEKWDNFTALL
jgi:hypothetical protein